jgi:hypothetical protein
VDPVISTEVSKAYKKYDVISTEVSRAYKKHYVISAEVSRAYKKHYVISTGAAQLRSGEISNLDREQPNEIFRRLAKRIR